MRDSAKGAEVAVLDDGTVAEVLMGGEVKLPDVEDPEEISRAIVARILAAETVDQVFQSAGATPAADMLDVPFKVQAIRWQKSAYDEGPAVFAMVEAVLATTGELVAISCGGRNVMAQLFQLQRLGKLTEGVYKIVRAPRQTAAGFWPLWLERAA